MEQYGSLDHLQSHSHGPIDVVQREMLSSEFDVPQLRRVDFELRILILYTCRIPID